MAFPTHQLSYLRPETPVGRSYAKSNCNSFQNVIFRLPGHCESQHRSMGTRVSTNKYYTNEMNEWMNGLELCPYGNLTLLRKTNLSEEKKKYYICYSCYEVVEICGKRKDRKVSLKKPDNLAGIWMCHLCLTWRKIKGNISR